MWAESALRKSGNTRQPGSATATTICLYAAGCSSKAGARREFVKLRSEEHTSELQSLMRISYAVFCLKKKNSTNSSNNSIHKNQYTTKTVILDQFSKQTTLNPY